MKGNEMFKSALKEQVRKALQPLLTAQRKSKKETPGQQAEKGEGGYSISRYLRGAVYGNWHRAEKERELYEEAQKAMSESTGESGGFIVPPEIMQQVIDVLTAKAVVRKLNPTVISGISGNALYIPRVTGGATAYWIGEGEEKTESALTFGMIQMVLKKCVAFVALTNELIEDSTPAADKIVRDHLGKALAVAEDEALISGTGGASPLGLLNIPGIQTMDLTADITYDDLVDAQTTLEENNASYTGWLTHPRGKAELRKLKDNQDRPLWVQSLSTKEPDSLLGLPIFYSTLVPADLTVGARTNTTALILGNWPDFVIAEKQAGVQMSTSTDRRFELDETLFKAVRRLDCAVRHTESFLIIRGV